MTELKQDSAYLPFAYRNFTLLWVASLISNIGTWMHSVGAGWLMTTLEPSPLMVALVQTATTLPVFFFALPAGALADLFDRQRILLWSNIALLLTATGFALVVYMEWQSGPLLLLFSALLGTGAAFTAPAWQAVVPQLVPKHALPQAVALGGISINLSRAIGPALAGLLISAFGFATPFVLNGLSFGAVIFALIWWGRNRERATDEKSSLPPEQIVGAMATGLRYARFSRPLLATMAHMFGFMLFANSFWSLLPLLAKQQLNTDAQGFGLLMAMVGAGAVLGGLALPKLRSWCKPNQIMAIGAFGIALNMGLFAVNQLQWLAFGASAVFGFCWTMVLSTLHVSAQQALPNWVRARGLAVYMMVFFGGLSLGAAIWGYLGQLAGLQTSLLTAAVGLALFTIVTYGIELQQAQAMDLRPANAWQAPRVEQSPAENAGPVVVQLEYLIEVADRATFLALMKRVQTIRQREGAYNWSVFEDLALPGRFYEQFMERSWIAHLRHHERVSKADLDLYTQVKALHADDLEVRARHFITLV